MGSLLRSKNYLFVAQMMAVYSTDADEEHTCMLESLLWVGFISCRYLLSPQQHLKSANDVHVCHRTSYIACKLVMVIEAKNAWWVDYLCLKQLCKQELLLSLVLDGTLAGNKKMTLESSGQHLAWRGKAWQQRLCCLSGNHNTPKYMRHVHIDGFTINMNHNIGSAFENFCNVIQLFQPNDL